MKNTNMHAGVLKAVLALRQRILFMVSVLGLVAGCATATKQPSVFNADPDLLTKQYTADEISRIQKNFEANPVQYSQELGNLFLWQIHNENSAFGRQLAELPDLNDGIDPKEDEALRTIHEYIKDVQFPSDFASEDKLDKPSTAMSIGNVVDYHLLVEWTSEKEESNKGMVLITDLTSNITLKEAKPRGFEDNDTINYMSPPNKRTNSVMINLTSSTSHDDKDGLELKFSADRSHSLDFEMHGKSIKFDIQHLSKQSKIESPRKYDKVTILEEITLDGLTLDQYRYSPSLQAFLWLIVDGKFDADSFERDYARSLTLLAEKMGRDELFWLGCRTNYPNSFYFTFAVWGDMEGPRWKDFGSVVDRLNAPELVHHYVNINSNFIYERGRNQIPSETFRFKTGQCISAAVFGEYCLKMAGYKAFIRSVNWPGDPYTTDHTGSGIVLEDGSYLLVIDFGPSGNRMSGPHKEVSDLDLQIAHGHRIIGRMWGHKDGAW